MGCGYESPHDYVVRTRPKNDGWMAIAHGNVIAEGIDKLEVAKEMCQRCEDDLIRELYNEAC